MFFQIHVKVRFYIRFRLRQAEGVNGASGGNADVLFALNGEGNGRSIDRTSHLKMPEGLQVGGIEGDEVSLGIAAEDEAPGGGENSGPRGRRVLKFAFNLTGCRVDCLQESEIRLRLFRGEVGAAVERVSRFIRLRRCAEDVALIARG